MKERTERAADTRAFKNAMRKAPTMKEGNLWRKWLICPKCLRFQFYDYVPYSLSNPVMVPACSHGLFKDLLPVATIQQSASGGRRRVVREETIMLKKSRD